MQSGEVSQSGQQAEGMLPVLPSMQEVMKADLAQAKDGRFCIFHDAPLSTRLEYVEFDPESGQLNLVLRWGVIQPFGEIVPQQFRPSLTAAQDIYVVLGQGGAIQDLYEVRILSHDSAGYGS